MKKYDQFVNERLLNKSKMDIAFEEAKKYLNAIHKHANEEHIVDFMIGYLFTNYGVDLTHLREIYKYVKHYVRHKINKKLKKGDKGL
jgi:coproporphyrinogen III oxidase-like Fe-S oxidoreductase